MVKERVQYVCEFCQKTYTTRDAAEDCEKRCHSFVHSDGLDVLNLSHRTFNALNWFGLYTVREVALMSEKDLKKIKGFGNWCLKEVKAKLAEYGIEKDPEPTITNPIKNKARGSSPQLDSNLNDKLKEKLIMFVESLDWPTQYKQYYHDVDSWDNGFYNIVELEKEISEHIALGYLTRKDVQKIARWERPHAKYRMTCQAVINIHVSEIEKTLGILEVGVKGNRTMFLTCILRFISPSKAGSLDANLVRVFGVGDSNLNKHQWLNLVVRRIEDTWNFAGNRWTWPNEYYKWNRILGLLASLLNDRNIACPHPNGFLGNSLRENGIWICADVEMALRAYANDVLLELDGHL